MPFSLNILCIAQKIATFCQKQKMCPLQPLHTRLSVRLRYMPFAEFQRRDSVFFAEDADKMAHAGVTGHLGNLQYGFVRQSEQVLRIFHAKLHQIMLEGHMIVPLKELRKPGM